MAFYKGITVSLFTAFLLWLATAGSGAAEEKFNLDFKDIELPALVQVISEVTGRNFVYDETVKGSVTVSSPLELSRNEAYNLFLTVLGVKGFTVVPSGKIHKIVPIKDAKESTLPVGGWGGGEQFVTRLVPLRNADATLLATTVLPPLLPKTSHIAAFAPANALLITDSAANIERLAGIVGELDRASALERIEVIPLSHAMAEEVAKIANQVLAQGATTSPRARGLAAQPAGDGSRVVPYAATNMLVVMASDEDIPGIRSLIERLDQKPSQQRSHINVYYLENADAEALAKTLSETLNKIMPATAPAAAGQPPAAAPTSGNVGIIADKPTNSLVINATPADYDIIEGIIRQLDIKRKQVFVEALILELSMDATKELGASLQGGIDVGSDSVIFGTSNLNGGPVNLGSLSPDDNGVPSLLTQSINGILLGGLFNPITTVINGQEVTIPALSALIDLSKTDSDINILSAPRLLTSDNEEAEIIVGSNVPIITNRLTDTGGSDGLAQSVSVERKDVALTLRLTPQITEGDQVRLQVNQEITDLAATNVGDVDQVGPTLTKRSVRNTVLAQDGRTIILGGLIGTNLQKTIAKTPFLGDIPGLGWLFKRERTEEKKTNLLVFITPKIIRNAEDLQEATDTASKAMDLSRIHEVSSPDVIDNLQPAAAEAENGSR
ncbi:type II secretion system secretin GspD [Trichloromonas sp.]|uniref:type II secretion system secretin GspD n=1 Tax=Trichloromonas sp. TaxID=3069249 RepID=UPI002A42357A|nr:type II secretion system secretin GspD [Trichloromonas sp.]